MQFSRRSLFLTAVLTFLASTSSFAQTAADDYVISGRVHDEGNRAVAGAWIFAVPHDYDKVRMARRALSDDNGNFVIEVGRPARYKLFAEKAGAGYFVQFSPVFRHPAVSIAEVALNETKKTALAVVTLAPKNGILFGKSLDSITGLSIESVRFLLCLSSNPEVCWSTYAKNARGEFRILTPHVPFTLSVTADGYETWFGLNGFQKNEPISIATGTTIEVALHLMRRREAANRPLSELEKQRSVYLPAPIQSSPADGAEISYVAQRRTRLEWQPVEGALFYKVEVDFCYGLVKSLRECRDPQPMALNERVMGTNYDFKFVAIQPGRWRVWAIDKKGQQGLKSPWWTFFHLK